MSERVILHVDMNCFFAAVEQQADPALRGKPIAVVGANSRTVIVTCSYEARAFGVRTGMTIPEGRKLCPHLILVHARNDRYADTCARLVRLYHDYTPDVEVASVDESYLEVTGTLRWWASRRGTRAPAEGRGPEPAVALAREIKARVRAETGLSCSIGIAPNKLLAKLASDLQKPDGLVVIRPEEIAARMENLPVEELCGIGTRTQEALAAMDIRTCGDLGRHPVEALVERFGIVGRRLSLMGRGIDGSPVAPLDAAPDAKSVGHSMTLPRDITAREDFEKQLLLLADMVGRRMRAGGYAGRTVALTLRYRDFTTFSRRHTLSHPTACAFEIFRAALAALDTIRLRQPVRLVGISVGRLVRGVEQAWLFGNLQRRDRVEQAMDKVNDRFGDRTVTRARLLDRRRRAGVISPAWRPEGVRRIDYT